MLRTPQDIELTYAELHDLCQPLTALQCQLEFSKAERGGDSTKRAGDSTEQMICAALEQTRRIFAVIERMRSRLGQIERSSLAHQSTRGTEMSTVR
ncbi:MAG: hypothetical protein ACP5E5_06090 [Acidobacteriaceae bacterium]